MAAAARCLLVVLVVLLRPSSALSSTAHPSLVPALFVLGDSTADAGTNNHLATFARADHPPYGRDFDGGKATGRFCNGKLPVDYLALRLGLPFVPPYLGRSGAVSEVVRGANYASAASGIIYLSGSDLGAHISLSGQMTQVLDTIQQLELELGQDVAAKLLSKAVFYVSIGSNDYIHYYFANMTGVQSRFSAWEFAEMLTGAIQQHLQRLHAAGARRIVVMGLPPLGCAPRYLWQSASRSGECVQNMNNVVMMFNFGMQYTVERINREHPGAEVIFCNTFQASMDILQNRERYGFETVTDACCGMGRYGGWMMCLWPGMACSNASAYVWWDQFHPTDAANRILADHVWDGGICYPRSLKHMIAK